VKRFLRGWAVAFGKVIAVTAGSLLVLVAIFYFGIFYWIASYLTLDIEHFRRHLPSTVRAASIEKASYTKFLPEGCGVIVLRLEKEVTGAIAAGRLDFLNKDLTRLSSETELEPWRSTPVESMGELDSDPGVLALSEECASDFTDQELQLIGSIRDKPGGYWTRKHDLLLIIYPGFEKLAFLVWE
jgi:hypothetical protein